MKIVNFSIQKMSYVGILILQLLKLPSWIQNLAASSQLAASTLTVD